MARLSAAFIGIFIMPYKEPLRAGLGLGFLGGPLIFDLSFVSLRSQSIKKHKDTQLRLASPPL